jgi:hypothetical protein
VVESLARISFFRLRSPLNELGQLVEFNANVAHGLKDFAEGRIGNSDTDCIIARGRRPLAARSDFECPHDGSEARGEYEQIVTRSGEACAMPTL